MNIFKKAARGIGRVATNIGKEAKRVAKKKVAGVSIEGGLSSLNPATLIRYAAKNPEGFKSDLKAGARNASVIAPIAGSFNPELQPITPGQGGVPETISNLPVGEGPSRYRSVMEFLGNNKDDILDYASALGNAYTGYQEGERADELFKRNRAEFERLRPLREAGMRGLMDTSRPDLSSTFAQEPQRYRRVSVGSGY